VFFKSEATLKIKKRNFRTQSNIVMTILERMVASGAADHRYDSVRKVDEFLSTETLIKHWSWAFPGDAFAADRSERHVTKLEGARSHYFE
jgi:hypothetical protein